MVVQHGKEATAHARDRYQSRTTAYHEKCLMNVRECLEIASRDDWAIHAWERASHKHHWTGDTDDIPFGAPVFSKGSSQYGHIFLSGGKFKNGHRIMWTTDQFGDGRITPVEISFFRDHWGHTILGWTSDLNGVYIPYLGTKTRKR